MEKNRVFIYKRMLTIYIPRVIKRISSAMPEAIQKYYEMYPFDIFGETNILRVLRKNGIREYQAEYQECYSAAMYAYMYSIHRCAYCGYTDKHVINYIKSMIGKAIIWGIVITREAHYICKANNLRIVYLDSAEKNDRW